MRATLAQRRKSQIAPLTQRISELQDTNDALGGLSSRLAALKGAALGFRAVSGGGVAKRFSSSNDGVVSGVAGNGAQVGSFEVSVLSLAKQGIGSFDDRFSSSFAVVAEGIDNNASEEDRSLSVTFGSGSGAETVRVSLTSTTSATELVDAFNSLATRGSAAFVNQGSASSPSYAIVFSAKNSGVDAGSVLLSVGPAVTATGAFQGTTISAASDATFSISGLGGTIRRSGNTVSDIVPGLSLNLASTGSATFSVKSDPSRTIKAVREVIDAFNQVVSFATEQDLVSVTNDIQGPTAVFSPLAGTQIDEGILSAIRVAFRGVSLGGSGSVNSLADLGITSTRQGTLSLDESKLSAAIATDPAQVDQLLQRVGDSLAASSGTIDLFTRYGGQIDSIKQSNTRQIEGYNRRAEAVEKLLARAEEQMRSQFSRLESLMGGLQQQQSALSALMRR